MVIRMYLLILVGTGLDVDEGMARHIGIRLKIPRLEVFRSGSGSGFSTMRYNEF